MAANRFSPGAPCCSAYTLYWHLRPKINGVDRDVLFRENERITKSALQFSPPRYFSCPLVAGTYPYIAGMNAAFSQHVSYDGHWLLFANPVNNGPGQPVGAYTKFYKVDQESNEVVWSVDLPNSGFSFHPNAVVGSFTKIVAIDKYRDGTNGDGRIFLQQGQSGNFSILASFNYTTGEIVDEWKVWANFPIDFVTQSNIVNDGPNFVNHNVIPSGEGSAPSASDRQISISIYSSAATYVQNYNWYGNNYSGVFTPGVGWKYSGSRRHVYQSFWEAGKLILIPAQSNSWSLGTTKDFSGSDAQFDQTVDFTNATNLPDYPRSWDHGGTYVNNGDPAASVGYVHPFDDVLDPSGIYYCLVYRKPPTSQQNPNQRARVEFWRLPPIVHEWPNEQVNGVSFPTGHYVEQGEVAFPSGNTDNNYTRILDDPSNGCRVSGRSRLTPQIQYINFRGRFQNVLYWATSTSSLMAFYPHWSTYGFNNATLGEIAGPIISLPHPEYTGVGAYRITGDLDGLAKVNQDLGGYFFNRNLNASVVPWQSLGWASNGYSIIGGVGFIMKMDNFSDKNS